MNTPVKQPVRPGTRSGPAATALRRLTAIAAVLFVLVLADALYMQFSAYQQGTYNNFHLTDAATVYIAAGFLGVITVVLVGLSWQANRNGR